MSEKLLNIASRPYPLKGVERNSCLLILIILFLAVILSFKFSSWEYLERSGSIIVIFGIYLAWKDITGRLNWAKSFTKAVIRNSKPQGIIASAMRSPEEKELGKKFENDVERSIELLKKRAKNLEAAILAIGTLVWGYGSLLGNVIYEFV